jgi:hypothetical protein
MWDVVLPNGRESEEIFAGFPYRPQKRKIAQSRCCSILVSGKSARVGSRGIEREGVPSELVSLIEARARTEDRNVSDEEYRRCRPRPLLLLHILKPTLNKEDFDTGGFPLIAAGISFPEFDDSDATHRVKYQVNLIEWRNLFGEENDDDMGEEDAI